MYTILCYFFNMRPVELPTVTGVALRPKIYRRCMHWFVPVHGVPYVSKQAAILYKTWCSYYELLVLTSSLLALKLSVLD